MAEDPIHFHGTIPNASGTPRNEVGGIALFGGVLMLSRTGFALAVRRPDGSIALRQVPFARFRKRQRFRRVPLLRGAMAHLDMMEIGTKGLRYSSALLERPREEPKELSGRRVAMILFSSLLALIAVLIFLPNLMTEGLGWLLVQGEWIAPDGQRFFRESESPIMFNLIAGAIRLLLLAGYVVAISLDRDIRQVFAYHGAEHKAVLALEEGRDVTVARARVHDTLHPRCGTTFLALASIAAIVTFAAVDALLPIFFSGFFERPWLEQKLLQLLFHGLSLPIVIGASFEILRLCARNPKHRLCHLALLPGYALQRLTTRQPSDEQLEVAIVALFGALAISPWDREAKRYVVRGLEDDETAPGYVPRSPARPAPPESGMGSAPPAEAG